MTTDHPHPSRVTVSADRYMVTGVRPEGEPPTCPVCGQDNAPDGPGCRCYGDPLPHHPTSADLATFRRQIDPLAGNMHPPVVTPTRYDHRARPVVTDPLARPVSGAWESERREGIGYRTDPSRWLNFQHAAARREASAMRSRAFERSTDCHPELVGIVGAWSRETREGCPDRFGPMLAGVPWRTGKPPEAPRESRVGAWVQENR